MPEQIRSSWGELIEEYLKNREQLPDVVLSSWMPGTSPRNSISMMAGWLEYFGIPFLVALTKSDKLPRSKLGPAVDEARRAVRPPSPRAADVLPFLRRDR